MAYDLEKDLTEWLPELTFLNGKNINYDSLKKCVEEGARVYGIEDMVIFSNETVKAGGLGNKVEQEALFVHNPQHLKDYVSFCIRLSKLGNVAFVNVDLYGGSKLLYSKLKRDQNKDRLTSGDAKQTVKGAVSGIYHLIRGDRANELKLEEEYHYMAIMAAIFAKMEEVKYDGIKTGFFGIN